MELNNVEFIFDKFLKDCDERHLPLPTRYLTYDDQLCKKNPKKYLFTTLCLQGYYETAKFMYEKYKELFEDKYILEFGRSKKYNNIIYSFIICSEHNNLEACQFLFPYLTPKQFRHALFIYIKHNFFKRSFDKNLLIDWFLSKKEYIECIIDKLFVKVCEYDITLFIALKIYDLYEISDITIKKAFVSDLMRYYNKIKILDWMIETLHVFFIIRSHKDDEQFNLAQHERKRICEYIVGKITRKKHKMLPLGFCFGGIYSLLCLKLPIYCFKFIQESLL